MGGSLRSRRVRDGRALVLALAAGPVAVGAAGLDEDVEFVATVEQAKGHWLVLEIEYQEAGTVLAGAFRGIESPATPAAGDRVAVALNAITGALAPLAEPPSGSLR